MRKRILLLAFSAISLFGKTQIDCITNYSGTWNASSHPKDFIEYNGWLYFYAISDQTGAELWRTNGTSGVTELFADIGMFRYSGGPSNFVIFQSELFFIATSSDFDGPQIWKTNGTVEGTIPVTKFRHNWNGDPGYVLHSLTLFNNELYFVHYEPLSGREIWKSDGTLLGTILLKDINPGTSAGLGNIPNFTIYNSNLYFFADDGIHGTELWKTNGSESGTEMIKDINPGTSSSFIDPTIPVSTETILTLYNDTMYFAAKHSSYGNELWKSDGTESGTQLVTDLNPGTPDSHPAVLTVSGSQLFFTANDGVLNKELWKTNGTSSGTTVVKDFWPGSPSGEPDCLADWNGTLYLQAKDNANGVELWKSDGTSSGTVMVKDIHTTNSSYPKFFHSYNGYLYFQSGAQGSGVELWRTDGTNAGTTLVSDILTGVLSSSPQGFINYDNRFVFNAAGVSGINKEPWISDGTASGTSCLREINTFENDYSVADDYCEFDNKIYFDAVQPFVGRELFVTGGTTATTGLFGDLISGSTGSFPKAYYAVHNKLYFQGEHMLFRSNGTLAGTNTVFNNSSLTPLNVYGKLNNKYAYFVSGNGSVKLYTCDSVSAPFLVKTLSSPPNECTEMNNILYFTTLYNGQHQLWRSDGTSGGTYVVKTLQTAFTGEVSLKHLTVYQNKLYFLGDNGTEGEELWQSDGTTNGTILFKDIASGNASSSPDNFAVYNDTLYFSADDGIHGVELWKTDGTTIGTQLYADIVPGLYSSFPINLVPGANCLYFSAFTENEGRELWIKKNTLDPELMIDIGPGKFSGNPSNLTLIDNCLYFTANDEVHGYEPYSTLGSECSTLMIQDLNIGDKGSDPFFIGSVNGKIIVRADTDLNNTEIYAFNAPFQATDTISACQNYYWAAINDTLETSGLYTAFLTNSLGCDSIVNLQLTVGQPSNTIQSVSACSSYTWINGTTYTSSNSTAMHTLTSVSGCDSTVVLNLTILNNNGTDVQTACQTYTWIDSITYTASTNTPTWTLINSNGCDSIVTLNLTITNPSSGTDVQSHCGSYTWVNGVTYTSSTNSPTYIYSNSQGCDSVVTLNLTITGNSSGIDTQSHCGSYTWVDGVTYNYSTNSPFYIYTNSEGCDSVVTLNLTIHENWIDTLQVSSCEPYYWEFANSTPNASGTYTFTYTGAAGCDSTQVLQLVILSSPNASIVDNGNGSLQELSGAPVFSWFNCNDSTNIVNSSSVFTPTQDGTYAVIVYDNLTLCQDTSDCIVFDFMGLDEIPEFDVQLQPNPTSDLVTITFDGNEAELVVYDALGKLIQTSTIVTGTQVSLKDVETGVYFFELKTEQERLVKRIVKN